MSGSENSFPGGNGPTLNFPSSSSARATAKDILRSISKKKHRPPPPPPSASASASRSPQQQHASIGVKRLNNHGQAQTQRRAANTSSPGPPPPPPARSATQTSDRDRDLATLDSLVELTSSATDANADGDGGSSNANSGHLPDHSERLRREAREHAAALRASAQAQLAQKNKKSDGGSGSGKSHSQSRLQTGAAAAAGAAAPPPSPGRVALDELLRMDAAASSSSSSHGGSRSSKRTNNSGDDSGSGKGAREKRTGKESGLSLRTSGSRAEGGIGKKLDAKLDSARRIIAQRKSQSGAGTNSTLATGGTGGERSSSSSASSASSSSSATLSHSSIADACSNDNVGRDGTSSGAASAIAEAIRRESQRLIRDNDAPSRGISGKRDGEGNAITATASRNSGGSGLSGLMPAVSDSILDSDSDSATEVFEVEPESTLLNDSLEDNSDEGGEDGYDPLDDLAAAGDGWTNARVSSIFGSRKKQGDRASAAALASSGPGDSGSGGLHRGGGGGNYDLSNDDDEESSTSDADMEEHGESDDHDTDEGSDSEEDGSDHEDQDSEVSKKVTAAILGVNLLKTTRMTKTKERTDTSPADTTLSKSERYIIKGKFTPDLSVMPF